MNTVLYRQGIRYSEKEYKKESDIEELVIQNSKTLFGNNCVYVEAKKKIAIVAMMKEGKIRDGLPWPRNW